jgi:hypothetical protein
MYFERDIKFLYYDVLINNICKFIADVKKSINLLKIKAMN